MVGGDHQLEGFDFTKTFAPVDEISSVRVLLSVAMACRGELHQMDVNNVFFHDDLEEDI